MRLNANDVFALSIILAAALIVLAVWTVSVYRRTRRVEDKIDKLFGDAASDNTARLLAEYVATVRQTAETVQRLKADQDQVSAILPSVIRHVGLVRFSPFRDTGGDQSFALALLNGDGDGVIITALHSRTDSRIYAKPVERFASSYSLTPEELEAMDRALGRATIAVT